MISVHPKAGRGRVRRMKLVLAGLLMAMGLTGVGCVPLKSLWGGEGEKIATVQSARFSVVLDEAAAGDERAQYSLGEMYSKGKGVAQNFSEAYAWYSIAAMNGHAEAEARMRAGWTQGNIARGKQRVEVLRARYHDAVIP